MQKTYELLYIVHPDLEGSIDKITEKVSGFITKNGGKVDLTEDWGKRKLAYPIAKNDFGVYALMNFTLDSIALSEVERELRLAEEVMRSMIVAIPEEKAVKESKKKAVTKKESEDKKQAKAEEPASIIVADDTKEEKAKRKTTKKSEEVAGNPETIEEKPAKKPVAKKATTKKATTKKVEATDKKVATNKTKTDEKAEAERLKKLDEKLDELLK